MHDMHVLTVWEIRDIMTVLGQDDQHLIDLPASLTGENTRNVRNQLSTGGDEAILTCIVAPGPQSGAIA